MPDIALAIVAVAALLGSDDPKEKAARSELEALQGTWEMISLEINGQKVPDRQVRTARLIVAGNRYTPLYDDRVISETFTLDPSRTPKAIEFTYVNGPRKGETVKGIYKVEGDRYIMCRAMGADDPRPTGFASQPDSGQALVVWRRARPASNDPAKLLEAHRERLEGTWIGVLGLRDGKRIVDDEANEVRLTLSGDHYTLVRGEQADRGTCRIEPLADPKTIDVTITDGEFKGQTWRGIYEVIGDSQKVCLAPEGQPRPTAFLSEPGSGHVLWVFTRAHP